MDYKIEFESRVSETIHRKGISELMEWLSGTDFYTAPASTRYHDACTGGLVSHSLSVMTWMKRLCKWFKCDESDESIAIVSLFHDVCKVGLYKVDKRWRKNEDNKWEQYDTWKRDEDFKFGGHGAKSVYLIQHFMPLHPQEAAAINCHMGQFDATTYSNPTEVYESNMLAWLLHVADEAATYLDCPLVDVSADTYSAETMQDMRDAIDRYCKANVGCAGCGLNRIASCSYAPPYYPEANPTQHMSDAEVVMAYKIIVKEVERCE